MKVKWCNRSLFQSPYYFGLATTERAFHDELKRLKVPKANWPNFMGSEHCNATVWYFSAPEGREIAIVCLGATDKKTGVQIAAMLVHEAVHIWQKVRGYVDESEPSAEFEAYAIQSISQELMLAYTLTLKRRNK